MKVVQAHASLGEFFAFDGGGAGGMMHTQCTDYERFLLSR